MVPTPALQYYVKCNADVVAGVMITASHNPPEYNGIKVIAGDGTEASPEDEAAVELKYEEDISGVSWNDVGTVRNVSGAGDMYVDSIVSKVDVGLIRKAELVAVLDCSNGASCYTSPLLLKRLGVRAISLNASARGEFPGHPSEPTEDNLSDLKRLVKETHANIGIAHDGDADRCVFVDNKGLFVPGDVTLALLAKNLVENAPEGQNKEVVTPVATSSLIDEVVKGAGGTVFRTAVGAPKVARRMIDDKAIFGGEENGGLIFPDHQFCRDGGMAVARMLETIARSGPLRKQIEALPEYFTTKLKVECSKDMYPAVKKMILANANGARIDETDGVKLTFDDGAWVLARSSGTEPLYRVYAESRDKDRAASLASHYERLIIDLLSKS
jgi:phosphomannomutase/phosphoglucomutase